MTSAPLATGRGGPAGKIRPAGRPPQSRVAEVRQRLTSGVAKPEFEYELLSMFVKNELGAMLTIPLLAVIIALASMFWAPPGEAMVWVGVVLLARSAQMSVCYKFRALPRAEVDLKKWRATLVGVEALYGVAWACVVLVGVNPSEPMAHTFVFASLVVVLTIRLLFASTVMPVIYAGTIPITFALVLRFLLLKDPFYWAMASMAVGIHVYFIFLAKGLNATVMTMLEYKAEKDSLIAELEQATSISEEARRRAEESNIAKSRFLANMSHELRTPLNAILGFSEVMKTEMMGPMQNPTYREYAEHIHSSGRHLLQVINEILDLSRIEAGKHELTEASVHLVDVVDECQRLLKLKAESKALKLIEALDDSLPPIWADERALRQVCINLLGNAIKFTPPGGQITLGVRRSEDGGQILSIRDTGPGIPKEELPRVMQAFGQGSLAHTSAEGGSGLGLPIVKSLVDLHGGTFELLSEVRRGTEAVVRLPKERVLQPVEPLQPLGEERHRPSKPRLAGLKSKGRAA
jgi:two-component system cell cycle sensor histidine kinase PleC